jgi:hypothetical protein
MAPQHLPVQLQLAGPRLTGRTGQHRGSGCDAGRVLLGTAWLLQAVVQGQLGQHLLGGLPWAVPLGVYQEFALGFQQQGGPRGNHDGSGLDGWNQQLCGAAGLLSL